MNRKEWREKLLQEKSVAGDTEFELGQIRKLQADQKPSEIHTLTVTCSEIMTVICC